uniref:NADH:ubiquinone reductase (H(+)-translocating) n=1 Tax=Acrobeloides nanus TaxID=290746 RepID=A0A914CH76_9BILA
MLGANYGFFAPNDITISLVTSTTGLISLIHTAMNLIFHEQYRIQIRRIARRILRLPPLSNTATAVIKFGAVSTFQRVAATRTVTTAWS